MPTEEQTRQLLAKAAATIDVEESAPITLTGLPEPRSRRWPVLAAAAAVVLAIGGGILVAQQLGDDPQPASPPANTDREPVEQEHVYADDEVPALVGYTEDEAVALLQARGVTVEVVRVDRCDQPRGYVLSTEPSAGTRLGPGEDVFVRVTGGPPPAARCVEPTGTWQQVFDLVRFARGLGPTPDLAGDVALSVGEDSPVRLSPAEAEDPDNWVICGDDQCHSALAALEETLTAPRRFLAVDEGSPRLCRFAEAPGDQALTEHGPSYVYGDEPTDGVFCPPLPVLQVGWTGDWRIASIRLRLEYAELDPGGSSSDVDRHAIADEFVEWARGDGPAPQFAEQVTALVGGYDFLTLTGADAASTEGWRLPCPRFMSAPCPESAVQILRRYEGTTVRVPLPTRSCFHGKGRVSADLATLAPHHLVRVDRPGTRPCRDTSLIELWIDDDGRIYAVDNTRLFE